MRFPRIEEIKKIRKQLDLTQNELAKLANVSQSTIAKLEKNSISASYEIVTRVFEALDNVGRNRKINKTVRDVYHSPVTSVHKDATLVEASELMKKKGFSQLPVMNSENVVGSISEQTILEILRSGVGVEEMSRIKVEDVMNEAYPVIPDTTPVETVASLLTYSSAVLVQKKGKIAGIVTKSDLLKLV
jgi:predicted transcriptional regulator